MTTMLQRSQTRGWEERGWATFHRLWNIGDEDDIGYGVPPESDETFCVVNISTAAPGDEDSTGEDNIEVEFLSKEDVMDIDHDGEDSFGKRRAKHNRADGRSKCCREYAAGA